MSRSRLKMTGCARFLIALIIIVPLAYFGARVIRGEGIPAVDNFLHRLVSKEEPQDPSSSPASKSDVKQIKQLQREIEALKEVNKSLNKQLDDCRAKHED